MRQFTSNLIDQTYLSIWRYYYVVKKGWLLIVTLHSSRPLSITQYRFLHWCRQSTIGININILSLPSPILPTLSYRQRYTHKNIYDNTQSRSVNKELAGCVHLTRCYCWVSSDYYALSLCIVEFTSTSRALRTTNTHRRSITHRPETPTIAAFLSRQLLNRRYRWARVVVSATNISLPPPTHLLLRQLPCWHRLACSNLAPPVDDHPPRTSRNKNSQVVDPNKRLA